MTAAEIVEALKDESINEEERMTSRDFCYWLQGVFEVGRQASLDQQQTEMIKAHLALVFKHEIDPSAGPLDHQKVLNEIHEALKKEPPKIGGTGPDGTIYRR